jgi:LmbE family N-acetylglucosaminyl deacetylase
MESRLFDSVTRALDLAVIVAHPDDETLWAGGMILSRPAWRWTIVSLCRKSDPDRAPKFARVLDRLGASGDMADLDDGPDQIPLAIADVQKAVLGLLPRRHYDAIITHSPFGEYTRHRRHEEVSEAVTSLWQAGALAAEEIWLFAYDDADRQRLPEPIDRAHLAFDLDADTLRAKRDIIVELYGFDANSWEARATPEREAFWCCRVPRDYQSWFAQEGNRR